MNASRSVASSSLEKQISVTEVTVDAALARDDLVAVEEPVEIRLVHGPENDRKMRSVSVTMRTPGHDEELAAGFLMTENIIQSADQIADFQFRGIDADGQQTGNIVRVELRPDISVDLARLQRNFYTTSSCGVCGKASLEALNVQGLVPLAADTFRITAERVRGLPELLRQQQATFNRTGGLHGAGLAGADGHLVDSREDVGRHNAVDKLVGRWFLDGKTPLHEYAMIVSGRVSFEIMQKALVAGIPLIIAVGAPSSLAIEMARQYHMTLVGFTSPARFNLYSAAERIADLPTSNSGNA